ncbi:MAG TPA: diaminobutyrate acetyltransferase [Hyphomonadaceae bacterium]|nr:diaminobutyrate acetyltransferase [Hyphomonadaceae bacterium]
MQHLAEAFTDIALEEEAAGNQPAFRRPKLSDGAGVHNLVASCPPLDRNSLYCNLLQCSHFAETSVVAEIGERIVGWVGGYILPGKPDHLFVWQVAVHPSARGQRLAEAMISEILRRPACEDVTHLTTSITDKNVASWRTFSRLSAALKTVLESQPWLRTETHLAGRHPTEHEVVIGPFAAAQAHT